MKRTLERKGSHTTEKQAIGRAIDRLLKLKRVPRGKEEKESRRAVKKSNVDIVVGALNGVIPEDYTESGAREALREPSRQRIKRAFDLILKIKAMPRGISDEWDWGAIAELTDLLARYPMVFKVEMDILGFPNFVRRVGHQRVDAHEANAMESLINLGVLSLSKLRTCECKKWYFARGSNRTSCSVACRKKKHEQTPEYKKRKAARAKAAYHYHLRD
jgi:hypothetical protein